MTSVDFARYVLGGFAVAGMLTGCGGSQSPIGALGAMPQSHSRSHTSIIKHVVVIVQENRSFDDLFATFPGADGTTEGLMKTPGGETYVPLKKVNLDTQCDPHHGYAGFLKSLDGGKMDGFALSGSKCGGNHTEPYQFVDPGQIVPYTTIASQYVLADHMFQTQGSGSFTAHQDLIAGATILDSQKTTSLVDLPTSTPWGCDAPGGTTTPELIWTGSEIIRKGKGPRPCVSYKTLRDLLDSKGITWKYYSPPMVGSGAEGKLWNAFDGIKAVRHSKEWGTNVTFSNTVIFQDISQNKLPAVSWVIPDREESDHPQSPRDDGPSWVASIVNVIGATPYWENTAIIVVWDDWGGFYDHVPPPLIDHWGGLGFRVPMLVVSAYARERHKGQPGYISHTKYEFGRILKFIEQTFDLGSLGTSDKRATGIGDCFDFNQPPRTFAKIPSSDTMEYFRRKAPLKLPTDTE